MNELIITIFLSVIFTFILFIISQFMMKCFKINSARNRFGVLIIVMLTSFSVFSFTIITADLEKGNSITNEVSTLSEKYSSLIMVVEETDMVQDNVFYDKNSITNSNNNSYTNPEINSFSPYYKITTFITNMSENNILFEIIKQYKNEKSSLIKQYNTNEEELEFSSNLINHVDNKNEKEKNETLFLFFMFNLFLLIISCSYLILSLLFGKTLILKKYNAKECRDPIINKIVQELIDDLKIKKIKIYLFNGYPNAFVFGLPASLALSTKLITCLSKKELKTVIRHELAHIKNKDIFIKPILQTMRIIFFYNPIVHVLYHMVIKERELMADSLFINSQDEKITLIEALIKIHEYTHKRKLFSQTIINTYSLSLITYNSKKLEIKDRYDHLFTKNIRKTFCSTLICLIILISNISMIAIARNVFYDNDQSTMENEFLIDDLDLVNNKNCSNNVKYIFRVFEDYHPEIYKKCVIYYILLDSRNDNFSQRDLFETIKLLVNN